MITQRKEIITQICKIVGIAHRERSYSPYLTKRELLQLHSWVKFANDLVKKQMKNREAGGIDESNTGESKP